MVKSGKNPLEYLLSQLKEGWIHNDVDTFGVNVDNKICLMLQEPSLKCAHLHRSKVSKLRKESCNR